MEDSNEFLQFLIDAIPAPIFYKDSDLIYRGCNAAFERFIGFPRDKIVGQTVYGVAPTELADIYHKADADLLESGGEQIYEAKVRYADGVVHLVEFRDPKSGKPLGMIGVMLDITDRRATELATLAARTQAEEANQAKSHFLVTGLNRSRDNMEWITGFAACL
jgi:PAS domain S-box-containing protein